MAFVCFVTQATFLFAVCVAWRDSSDVSTNAREPSAAPITKHLGVVEPSSEEPDLMDVYKHNDQTRNGVTAWVTPEIVKTSLFNYGLGPPIPTLAKETYGPIQHDFISQMGARLAAGGQQVNYLEVGVSVLKGIHTNINFFQGAVVSAFDIEDPNPLIASKWPNKREVDSWPASKFRKRHGRTHDYINEYDGPNSNQIYYQAGDALDTSSYEHMKNTIVSKHGPMNLILSDGLHTGEAVEQEVDHLIQNGIIQPGKDFAMVWDDCLHIKEDGSRKYQDIYDSVKEKNFVKLRSLFKGQPVCAGRFEIPGWTGVNEFVHGTCIFTTLDISGPNLGASKTWTPQSNDVKCSLA